MHFLIFLYSSAFEFYVYLVCIMRVSVCDTALKVRCKWSVSNPSCPVIFSFFEVLTLHY